MKHFVYFTVAGLLVVGSSQLGRAQSPTQAELQDQTIESVPLFVNQDLLSDKPPKNYWNRIIWAIQKSANVYQTRYFDKHSFFALDFDMDMREKFREEGISLTITQQDYDDLFSGRELRFDKNTYDGQRASQIMRQRLADRVIGEAGQILLVSFKPSKENSDLDASLPTSDRKYMTSIPVSLGYNKNDGITGNGALRLEFARNSKFFMGWDKRLELVIVREDGKIKTDRLSFRLGSRSSDTDRRIIFEAFYRLREREDQFRTYYKGFGIGASYSIKFSTGHSQTSKDGKPHEFVMTEESEKKKK